MSAFDSYVQAKYHGGTIPGGPTFTVVHDAETPLSVGYCDSIVEFFRKGPAAGTSAHAMVDPSKAVKQLPDNVVAYAAGPVANTYGWHLEQAGYAAFTRAQWMTPDGMAQMQRVGACLREVHDTWGIPKRWVTDDQLRAAAKGDRSQGGMTTHQQVARALGGTTHTDPETNYPRDLLLSVVLNQEEDDMTPEQDTMLRFLYNRISGRDVQRWMKQNPDGSPVITGPDDKDGWPARSVDIADILTLTGVVSGGNAAVLKSVDAGSAADADRDARLASAVAALGADPAAVVDALRAGLGDEFAKQVADELGKRLSSQ